VSPRVIELTPAFAAHADLSKLNRQAGQSPLPVAALSRRAPEPKRAPGETATARFGLPWFTKSNRHRQLGDVARTDPGVDRVIVRVDGSWELAAVVELRFELAAMDAAEPMPLIETAGVSVLSVHVDLHQFDATSPDQLAS
jgi:hypothetical protein